MRPSYVSDLIACSTMGGEGYHAPSAAIRPVEELPPQDIDRRWRTRAERAGPCEPPPKPAEPAVVDWGDLGLGQRSDAAIARELGVSRAMVRRARVHFGIPPAHVRFLVDWSQVPDLGAESDGAIARRLGVNISTVGRHRQRYGIPPAGSPLQERHE